jgi:uncharacterized protein (TIGR00369 family)
VPTDLTDTLRAIVEERTPHNRYLGMRLGAVGAGEATCTLPRVETLIGDAGGTAIHSGAIAALIDVTSGAAVCMKLGRLQRMATLGLRIDFLRSANPGEHLTAHAHCYKVTRSIAFVRAFAHDGDPADPVVASQGTFALTDD